MFSNISLGDKRQGENAYREKNTNLVLIRKKELRVNDSLLAHETGAAWDLETVERWDERLRPFHFRNPKE